MQEKQSYTEPHYRPKQLPSSQISRSLPEANVRFL